MSVGTGMGLYGLWLKIDTSVTATVNADIVVKMMYWYGSSNYYRQIFSFISLWDMLSAAGLFSFLLGDLTRVLSVCFYEVGGKVGDCFVGLNLHPLLCACDFKESGDTNGGYNCTRGGGIWDRIIAFCCKLSSILDLIEQNFNMRDGRSYHVHVFYICCEHAFLYLSVRDIEME